MSLPEIHLVLRRERHAQALADLRALVVAHPADAQKLQRTLVRESEDN